MVVVGLGGRQRLRREEGDEVGAEQEDGEAQEHELHAVHGGCAKPRQVPGQEGRWLRPVTPLFPPRPLPLSSAPPPRGWSPATCAAQTRSSSSSASTLRSRPRREMRWHSDATSATAKSRSSSKQLSGRVGGAALGGGWSGWRSWEVGQSREEGRPWRMRARGGGGGRGGARCGEDGAAREEGNGGSGARRRGDWGWRRWEVGRPGRRAVLEEGCAGGWRRWEVRRPGRWEVEEWRRRWEMWSGIGGGF